MRLVNMLTLPGGVPEQGREVPIRLRYRGPGGVPHQRDVVGVMMPLSEVEAAGVELRARLEAAKEGAALPYGSEYVIQLLQASLRDPADPAARLVEDPKDMQALRDGLVHPQYKALLLEYRELLRSEYPDVVTAEDERQLEAQARAFLDGDQPARG